MGSGSTACGKSEAVPSEVPAMCTLHRLCLALILCLLAFVCAHAADTQTGGVPAPGNKAPLAPPAQTPAPGSSDTSDTRAGLIKLDVTVTDNSGKSISGLQPGDFTLLDNGRPNRILSFQAFDGISTKPDPPVEVIVVIDALQVPSDLGKKTGEDGKQPDCAIIARTHVAAAQLPAALPPEGSSSKLPG